MEPACSRVTKEETAALQTIYTNVLDGHLAEAASVVAGSFPVGTGQGTDGGEREGRAAIVSGRPPGEGLITAARVGASGGGFVIELLS